MPERIIEWSVGAGIAVIGYFVRDIHVRFDRHLDENQRAHDQMRSAMAEAREEAGRVEERQDSLKEQLAEMRGVLNELRTAVLTLPQTIARVVCEPRHGGERD